MSDLATSISLPAPGERSSRAAPRTTASELRSSCEMTAISSERVSLTLRGAKTAAGASYVCSPFSELPERDIGDISHDYQPSAEPYAARGRRVGTPAHSANDRREGLSDTAHTPVRGHTLPNK